MMRSLYTFVLAGLLLPGIARAQGDEVSVNARLSQQQAYVGEILEYQIVIANAQQATPPEIDWPTGVKVSYQGSNTISQKFSSLDPQTGRMKLRARNTTLLTYRLVTSGEGRYTVPGTTITIDGQEHAINPVTFTILEPPEADDFDLVVELDRTQVFVGETLRLKVHWYLTSSVSEYSFRPSTKHDSIEAFSEEDASQLSRREQLYPIDLFGIRTVGRLRDSTRNGQRTRVLYFEILIRPTEPGTFDLGPVAVLFDRRTNRGTNARTISRSDTLTIEAQSPPVIGQPDGYTGLIGQFTLEASASPTSAHVGEPIDLTVTVRGSELLREVRNGPNLGVIPGFTDDFRLSPDGWQREPSRAGEKVFSTKIRAMSGVIEAIPPIRLPYFDPVRGEYFTAETRAIPLDIESVRTTTIRDAVGATTPKPEARSISRDGPIFWAEDRGNRLLNRDPVTVLSITNNPVWIGAATVPPAVYGVAFVLSVWRRSRNPELARELGRLHAAIRMNSRGDHAGAASLAIETTLRISPEAVTSTDAMRLPVSAEHRAALSSALLSRETGFGEHDPETASIGTDQIRAAIESVVDAVKRGAR